MNKHVFLTIAACGGMLLSASVVNAQESVVVDEVAITETPCVTRYYNTWRDGWFLQAGAGVNFPMVEGYKHSDKKQNVTAAYNLGVGRWFSPYMGFRFSGYYGAVHYDDGGAVNRFRTANLNLDFMWDMLNSVGGVDSKRVFSIVPFVGLGGTYNWKFRTVDGNVRNSSGGKDNTWTMPVSAGVQLRLRLCKYADFFVEGRAAFHGDNFNNVAFGKPIDVNTQLTGGFCINFGGREFQEFEPCSYMAYISNLNNQVNGLRGELAETAAALAAAEAQLPCPEVTAVVADCPETAVAMLSTVRFALDSYEVTQMEMVNVYNVAEYMKANPDVSMVITGFADKDTGTAQYNQVLSERRAQAVYDLLVNKYGVSPDRLTKAGEGSSVQPYDTNNWNRIVIFTQQ